MFFYFTMFWYSFDSPQVKRNLISSITDLVFTLPGKCPNNKILRYYQKNLKFECGGTPKAGLLSQDQTLAIAFKSHAKPDIKPHYNCPAQPHHPTQDTLPGNVGIHQNKSNNCSVPNFFDVKKDVLKMQLTKILKFRKSYRNYLKKKTKLKRNE